jgi:hypothetical protein
MPVRFIYLAALAALIPLLSARAAQPDTTDVPGFGSGAGFEVVLTNSGFGLGAYGHLGIGATTSLIGEISLGAGKDEREVKFFGSGRTFIPHKANYLLVLPAHVGIQQRLFAQSIEDDFRPYLQLTAGPTLGWEYPYFEDENENGVYDEGERTYDAFTALPKGSLRPGVGGMVAIGANFGTGERAVQGVRLGYVFHYFFDGVQLLEPVIQPRQYFLGSPTITLTFGRLF